MMKYKGWLYGLPCALMLSAAVPKGDPAVLRGKLFRLPVEINAHAAARSALADDKELRQLGRAYQARVQRARSECKNMACYAAALRLREDEVQRAGNRLVAHYLQGNGMPDVVRAVRETGYYSKGAKTADTALLRFAWERTAEGMNYVFDTYLAGKRPRYAIIDSISFNVNDPAFKALVEKMMDRRLKKQKNAAPFYALPLDLAMETLLINGRDEAARYEPLTGGQNAEAYAAVAHTDWGKYPYTALLVPGFGPDSPGVRIDHRGVARCKMAAERFHRKMAPFIIVSGGHVYPHRTPYSEAVEMKRYLTEELHIPASAIIIEPHARHTTTNMRNAGRLLYRFNMPANKPSLVVTDSAQILMVANLDQRCMRELGIVPYRDVKILNGNEAEFYPVKHCFYINVQDISDP